MKGQIAVNTKHSGDPRKDHRGYAEPFTSEQVDGLLSEAWLRQMVTDIRAGQEEKKDQLPFICPHYRRFNNNHRAQADIIPEAFTFMTCVDVDDKALVEQAIKRSLELNSETGGEWEDMVLRIDYSARKKVHIWILIPVGKTISEAQMMFCQDIEVPYDESCVTPERFIYVTGIDEEVYRSERWLEMLSDDEVEERREAYLNRGLDVDGRPLKKGEGDSTHGVRQPSDIAGDATDDARTQCAAAEADDRTRFIAEGVMKAKGLVADDFLVEGRRHTSVKMFLGGATQLLSKAETNGVLAELMPDHWKDQNIQQLVNDFYAKYTDPNQRLLRYQEDLFTQSRNLQGGSNQATVPAEAEPQFRVKVSKLPIGLREILKKRPENLHLPLLVGQMPAMMALADGVTVRYCDGKNMQLGGMAIIIGEQASNKSAIEEAVELWLAELRKEDQVVRDREDKVREANRMRKANERAQQAPAGVVRVVPITISCSKLLKRLKQSMEHCLYSITTEAETLLKSNNSGTWAQKWDIYRNAFGRERWGTDFNSEQSESGDVRVAYNWTILGTPRTVRRMFSGRNESNAENGLSSRCMVSEMPDTMFARITVFQELSADDLLKVENAVHILRSATGFYDTPRLRKAIDKWVEDKRVEASQKMDRIMDVYRRRAAVIGFRCGVVFMLLEGAESKACVEFALMMAEYTLHMQLKVFGPILLKQYSKDADYDSGTTVNGNIYGRLPESFTLQNLRLLKGREFADGTLYSIISRWKADGWVEKTGKDKWTKILKL